MKANLTVRFTKFTTDVIRALTGLPPAVETTIFKRQLIRAVTSVGANYFESQHAASKADFINKLHIASKELNETIYWLEVLKDLQLNNPIVQTSVMLSMN
jgi:four helix bundle protein